MKRNLRVPHLRVIVTILAALFIIAGSRSQPGTPLKTQAAATYDYVDGTYTDDFANTAGILTARSYRANVDTGSGSLKLTNSGGTFTAPFYAEGFAITQPLLSAEDITNGVSVAQYQSIDITGTIPEGTQVKVQVLDLTPFPSAERLVPDTLLPGNSTGFTSFPVDISPLFPPSIVDITAGKISRLSLKITLSTTDTNLTPSIDSLTLSWIPRQGDLSATFLLSTGLGSQYNDNRGTSQSPYHNDQIYPTFKWVSPEVPGPNIVSPPLIYQDSIVFPSWVTDASLFSINRNSGHLQYQQPFRSYFNGTLGENGTLYGTEQSNDILIANDAATGSVKWSYQFSVGHGNNHVLLADDGTLYTIRSSSPLNTLRLYAFNPDGTVNFIQEITQDDAYQVNAGPISTGIDGSLYFGTTTLNASSQRTNLGNLYSIDPSTQTVNWVYDTGDIDIYNIPPIVDTDGTIYVASTGASTLETEKKLYAINGDGTLKWVTSTGSNTHTGYQKMSLRSDGILMIHYSTSATDEHRSRVEAVQTSDGTVLWSSAYTTLDHLFTDSANGTYIIEAISAISADEQTVRILYYDDTFNLKWSFPYSFTGADGDNYQYYRLNKPIIDERGWLYSILSRTYLNSGMQIVPDELYIRPFALAPLTLSTAHNVPAGVTPGSEIQFTVTTSMAPTNPMSGDANYLQVILGNGSIISLTHTSTDENGNYVWTGSYVLPVDTALGTFDYSVELSQAGIETDVHLHFDDPPEGSNNTGISVSGAIEVVQQIPQDEPETPEQSPEILPETGEGTFPMIVLGLIVMTAVFNQGKFLRRG